VALFLGCDPGAKGAICLLDPSKRIARFGPAPGGKIPSGVIYKAILGDHMDLIARAAIEEVHSLYGMSAKSNFSFGWNCGSASTMLEILLDPYNVELERVQPKIWQKVTGVTERKVGKDIKPVVAEVALELYPNAVLHGPKGGLMDGRADALMLAHYLFMLSQGE